MVAICFQRHVHFPFPHRLLYLRFVERSALFRGLRIQGRKNMSDKCVGGIVDRDDYARKLVGQVPAYPNLFDYRVGGEGLDEFVVPLARISYSWS